MIKKLSFFLLLLFFQIGLSAQTLLDKPVRFSVKDTPISEALLALSEQVDINITFSSHFFSKQEKVTLTETQKPLRVVLEKILTHSNIGFKLSHGGIILFEKSTPRMTLSGYLTDATTGERLVGAHLLELRSMEGGTSNAYGFYSQNFKQGKVKIRVSYLGYKTKILEFHLTNSKKLNIGLEPSLTLKEIIVIAKTDSSIIQQGSEITLPLSQLPLLPTMGGEPDIMRYIQLLPGVQSGADGFGGLHVRGGNSDQNLILFDDVPIYNPSHTFGLFSIFNPDIIKSVKFYKGGFPARYDSRISSVLDIRTREGNSQQFSGEFSVSTLTTRGLIEIPLNRGKGGILIAARQTHLNFWLAPLSKKLKTKETLDGEKSNGETKYLFADFNAKAHYSLNKKNKIYLSFYKGKDDFSDKTMRKSENDPVISFSQKSNYALKWGNKITSLRWNHLFNDKIFANTTATYSQFQYASEYNSEAQFSTFGFNLEAFRAKELYSSTISDFSIRTDIDYFYNHKNQFRFGANAIRRNFSPGVLETNFVGIELDSLPRFAENNLSKTIKTNEFNLYVEDIFQRNNWTLHAGFRLGIFSQNKKTILLPQPRLSASYRFNDFVNANMTLARTTQFLHLLTKSDSGLPKDLWLPTSTNTSPQSAWQITGKLSGRLGKNTQWSAEGFWKKMDNLYQITPSEADASNPHKKIQINGENWEDFVERGYGNASGIEVSLEQQKGKWTGWLSYTFSKTMRNFDGKTTPFLFDSRHGISVSSIFQLHKNIDCSVSWLFQSGRPFSPSGFSIEDLPPSIIDLAKTSSLSSSQFRLPAYHRLDAGLNFHFGKKRWKHLFNIGIYNAYNRQNVFFAYLSNPSLPEDKREIKAVYSLPVLPSLSYSVKW